MGTYNGHKNWNHWNVSLWINNDEGLYRLALDHARARGVPRRQAAVNFLRDIADCGGLTHTPDGAKYTISSVMGAMSGM